MRLIPDIAWRTAEHDSRMLDARLLPLLRALRSRPTLRSAVAAVGLSYRSAWDLLGVQTRALGAPLVLLKRGRGARLAPLAERLLAADDDARHVLEGTAGLAVKVDAAKAGARLRCAASHDLLLAEFVADGGLELDVGFRGSMESVSAYAAGHVELAGFHVLADERDSATPYLSVLNARRDRLVRFAEREQGLMVAPGNPKRIRSLADVAQRGARFINRQRGSGTRALIDRLLRRAGLAPEDVKGYGDEEFTHLAVAATIAAGRADAGVGVRAAAARFGLAFVPLGRERYWLATRRQTLGERRMERFLTALRGPSLARLAKRLAGYDAAGAGEVVPISALEEAL
jgi:molybdate-binding protein/molybdenum-dependent DNA-binding transcriptional regulator ModE